MNVTKLGTNLAAPPLLKQKQKDSFSQVFDNADNADNDIDSNETNNVANKKKSRGRLKIEMSFLHFSTMRLRKEIISKTKKKPCFNLFDQTNADLIKGVRVYKVYVKKEYFVFKLVGCQIYSIKNVEN